MEDEVVSLARYLKLIGLRLKMQRSFRVLILHHSPTGTNFTYSSASVALCINMHEKARWTAFNTNGQVFGQNLLKADNFVKLDTKM